MGVPRWGATAGAAAPRPGLPLLSDGGRGCHPVNDDLSGQAADSVCRATGVPRGDESGPQTRVVVHVTHSTFYYMGSLVAALPSPFWQPGEREGAALTAPGSPV